MAQFSVTVKLLNHKLEIDHMLHKISSLTDEVIWTCPHADMDIDFDYPQGTPFAAAHFVVPKGTPVTSGKANPPKKKYPYRITLYNSTYVLGTVTIDPEVDVDSGPPNGRGKATGKKTSKKAAKKRK